MDFKSKFDLNKPIFSDYKASNDSVPFNKSVLNKAMYTSNI